MIAQDLSIQPKPYPGVAGCHHLRKNQFRAAVLLTVDHLKVLPTKDILGGCPFRPDQMGHTLFSGLTGHRVCQREI